MVKWSRSLRMLGDYCGVFRGHLCFSGCLFLCGLRLTFFVLDSVAPSVLVSRENLTSRGGALSVA